MSMSRGLLNNWWYVFDELHVVTRIIIFSDILPVNYPGTKWSKRGFMNVCGTLTRYTVNLGTASICSNSKIKHVTA